MHEVQTNLKNAKDLEDDALLEAVVYGWEIVCKENADQAHLVSAAQFEQWVNFRNETSLKMHEVIDFSDGPISEKDRQYLESIANMIASASHKTEAEIIAESERAAKREQEIAQERTIQQDETLMDTLVRVSEKKQSLLGRLKKLFTK
jgi:hypothetical protein